eukprot:14305379-Ditylum_brightwellii.AAC.1
MDHCDYEVPLDDLVDNETGRTCDDTDCGGDLRDNFVHFEENLTVVLGSSLKVEPAASLPFKSKQRNTSLNAKAAIVSLQTTPFDAEADLIIHATCDKVMDCVAKVLHGESWDDFLSPEIY